MIGSTRAVRVFAYTAPVDMRKSYSGLEGLVRSQLGHDPLRGDVYLFTSKDRRKAKVFFFDGTGVCIYMKRLCRGRFARETRDAKTRPLVSKQHPHLPDDLRLDHLVYLPAGE